MVHTKKKYNSNEGMSTDIWGPALWHFLHTVSFNYPCNPTDEDKENYRALVNNLQYILPCMNCRSNLQDKLLKTPLTNDNLCSRKAFSKYIYYLHENVNTMLHKKSNITYKQLRRKYETFRSLSKSKKYHKHRNNHTTNNNKSCTVKNKCILRIVPKSVQCNTFE
jgi:hypothetical protein